MSTEGPQSARETKTYPTTGQKHAAKTVPATRCPPTIAGCPQKQATAGCQPTRETASQRNCSSNMLATHGSQLPAEAGYRMLLAGHQGRASLKLFQQQASLPRQPAARSSPQKQATTGCWPARDATSHRNCTNNMLGTQASQLPAAACRSRPPYIGCWPAREARSH
jgi:hypothetical protein